MTTNNELANEFDAIVSQLTDVKTTSKKTQRKYKTYWSIPAGIILLLTGFAILISAVWFKIIILGVAGFAIAVYGMYVLVDRTLNSLTVDKTVRKANSFKQYLDKLDQERFGIKEDKPRGEYLT